MGMAYFNAAAVAGTGAPCIGYLIGLGAQKGGSSSAWRYMYNDGGAHPRIKVCSRMFYSNTTVNRRHLVKFFMGMTSSISISNRTSEQSRQGTFDNTHCSSTEDSIA
jgi:hypothetical protein